ncbi:MAG: F0F1 ATP synthase subunit A [Planctomycetota bacterium]
MLPLTLAADNPLTHVIDHAIIKAGNYFILSNHMVMVTVAAVLMLLVFPKITEKYRQGELVPTGTRNFFEVILVYLRDDVAKPALGDQTTKYMPFLWTLFFFILFCNLLGLLPLDVLTKPLMVIPGIEYSIYGTATSNLGVTFVLALFAFVFWTYNGIKTVGFSAWASHFTAGTPWFMWIIMVPVEFVGMLVKPAALMIRLFANMTGGHILLAVLISFVALAYKGFGGGAGGTVGAIGIGIPVLIGTVAIMFLELFIAFLQAYIFTFLTALFLGQMVAHHHDDHAHHEPDFDYTNDEIPAEPGPAAPYPHDPKAMPT